jgi:ribosome modulation factor
MAKAKPDKLGNLRPDVFLEHYRKIRDMAREQRDLSMSIARAKKQAKTDGVDLDTLRLIERFAKLEDDQAESQLRKFFQYAVWLDMPIGSQKTLFETTYTPVPEEASQQQQLWQAQEDGYYAGLEGKARDANPYVAGSEPYSTYDRSWLSGAQKRAKEQKPGVTEANPRRGRRKAGANGHAAGATDSASLV